MEVQWAKITDSREVCDSREKCQQNEVDLMLHINTALKVFPLEMKERQFLGMVINLPHCLIFREHNA